MNETSKSALRRARDPAFVQHYFSGVGIDIGAGSDPLSAHMHLFPKMKSVVAWDRQHGDALYMEGVEDDVFDFVHSSHCLEHLPNPAQALSRWLEVVRPGGYVIVTVPDEDLYEKGTWPSRFNADHRVSFSIHDPYKRLPASVSVLELVTSLSHVATCERVVLVREHYDSARHHIDQTAYGIAECSIEIVLRRRDVPSAGRLMQAAERSSNPEEALVGYQQALHAWPYRFEVYQRTMVALVHAGHAAQTDGLWAACVARLPNEYMPRLYQALNTIALGRLNEGFRQREALFAGSGWQRRTTAAPPSWAQWHGEPLIGKSIAIWSEFGLGDEIFFYRFARVLRERFGAEMVTVVCQAPLFELFRAQSLDVRVCSVDKAHELDRHDYWTYPHAICSHLPLTLEQLPPTVPYLAASPTDALPGVRGNLKVGIVFRGAPTHENDRWRSLPSLSLLAPLFALEGIDFYSLQKGQGEAEVVQYAMSHARFYNLGPGLIDMLDTARAVAALDVVVAVDTSVAHLAGAMGKPLLLLLPAYGDWRWHYTRDDSPWYPTAQLFRCGWKGGYESVVESVRRALVRLRDMRHSTPAEAER